MRKIEKETLQVIENYKSDVINSLQLDMKKLEDKIKSEIKEDFNKTFEKEKIKALIEVFQTKYDEYINIHFELNIYEYGSHYREIYKKDLRVQEIQHIIDKINEEKRKIKLALQCYDTNSPEYKEALEKLYNQH